MSVKLLLVIVGIALIYWISNIRKRKIFRRHKLIQRNLTTIHGKEIQAFLSPDIPLECLRQDGIHYGESFQLKEIPELPHNSQCQCKVVELSFTSTEIFQGALRKISPRNSSIGPLESAETLILKEMLIGLYTQPSIADIANYLEQFEWSKIAPEKIDEIKSLVRQKFEQLKDGETSKIQSIEVDQE